VITLTIVASLIASAPCEEIEIDQSFPTFEACVRAGETWIVQHASDPADFHATCQDAEATPDPKLKTSDRVEFDPAVNTCRARNSALAREYAHRAVAEFTPDLR
jgi:hypothetical protein